MVDHDTWFHIPEKFPLRDRICGKAVFFRVLYYFRVLPGSNGRMSIAGYLPKNRSTLFVLSLRVTGNVLRPLHSFLPLVDIPCTDLSFLGDLCCGMYPFSSYPPSKVSLCHSVSNGHTWMARQPRHLARRGALISRPIFFSNINRQGSPPTSRIADNAVVS